MCAENSQEQLQENVSRLRDFVRQSSQLEKRIQSTLNDVREIRDEMEELLASLRRIRTGRLREVFDGQPETDGAPAGSVPDDREPSEQQDDGADPTPVSGTGEQEEGSETPEPAGAADETDEPLKAGDFPGDDELDWEPGNTGETDDGRDAGDAPSSDEGTSSYRRRMVRKDPRLQDAPEEVLEAIAEAEELFQEAERGIQVLESLSVQSRSAQLAIWAARARKIQDRLEEWSEVLPDDFSRKMHVFFGKLTTVTRENECKWIDALKRSFSTDWDRYLEEQERKLRLNLQREKRAREFLQEPPRERKKDRKICRRRLRELASEDDPARDEVKTTLIEGMDLLAMDDPAVIEIAERFTALLDEVDELQPLKEVIEDRKTDAEREREEPDQPEVYRRPTLGPDVEEEILQTTRDKRVLALADDVTNEWKRRIEDSFQFENLTWLDIVDDGEPSLSEQLDQLNLNQYHYILLMKSRIGGEYSKALQTCREQPAETLIVEEGIGIAPIRDALQDQFAETA